MHTRIAQRLKIRANELAARQVGVQKAGAWPGVRVAQGHNEPLLGQADRSEDAAPYNRLVIAIAPPAQVERHQHQRRLIGCRLQCQRGGQQRPVDSLRHIESRRAPVARVDAWWRCDIAPAGANDAAEAGWWRGVGSALLLCVTHAASHSPTYVE